MQATLAASLGCISIDLGAQDSTGSVSPAASAGGAVSTNLTNGALTGRGLSLRETLEKVLIHNESLQVKLLDTEIARRQYKAEKGIFEPAVVGSYEHVDSERENTTEQYRQLGLPARSAFDENNEMFNGGLEFLSPVGSRFRLGYNLRRLENNLNRALTGSEYVTTLGSTLTQPLLKNFGIGPTMVRIRLAAINSDLAFQEYRRQLMLTVSRAEAAYWDLYLTQEQDRISQDSVRLAESLYKDNKARLEAGKSSELEVLQAEAGLALRLTRRNDADQKRNEAATQLSTMFSASSLDEHELIRAVEEPLVREVSTDYYDSYSSAFQNNPDYLTRRAQAVAENVRLAYAKNQLLPQLDLKGSYGLNGLGETPAHSFDDVERSQFEAWSVGVEMRIPVTGGIKERNEYKAAKLAKQKALVGLKEIEVQVGNALNTSILKVKNLRQSIDSYRSVINFHQELLETQLARLEVGVVDSRAVLETEEKLFEAKVAVLENMVQYQKALLELELIKGAVLLNRGLEISKAELQETTERMLALNRFSGPEFDNLKKEIQAEYKDRIRNLDANEQKQSFRDSIFK